LLASCTRGAPRFWPALRRRYASYLSAAQTEGNAQLLTHTTPHNSHNPPQRLIDAITAQLALAAEAVGSGTGASESGDGGGGAHRGSGGGGEQRAASGAGGAVASEGTSAAAASATFLMDSLAQLYTLNQQHTRAFHVCLRLRRPIVFQLGGFNVISIYKYRCACACASRSLFSWVCYYV
jgi:hypothetical protein